MYDLVSIAGDVRAIDVDTASSRIESLGSGEEPLSVRVCADGDGVNRVV